jgi:hypothetical protein
MANSNKSKNTEGLRFPPGFDAQDREVLVTEIALVTKDEQLLYDDIEGIELQMGRARKSDNQSQIALLARTRWGRPIILRKEDGLNISLGMKRDFSAAANAMSLIKAARTRAAADMFAEERRLTQKGVEMVMDASAHQVE